MKKFSKVLAVALAVLMLMMTSITAFADSELPRIPKDELIECYMPGGYSDEYYFTTRNEGWYVLNGYADEDGADPYIRVTDSYDEEIAYGDDSIYQSRDCEVWFYAERGETYYIELGNYGYTDDGVASVSFYFEAENEDSHVICWDYDGDAYCDWCGWRYCDHKCHDGGFFWKITNFFNRLFGINEYCECGLYHW